MSSSGQVTMKDLVEEAKKRIIVLAICVIGLSYLMSLTSSSVWVNLPAAAILVITLRYFSFDLEMRKKASVYNNNKTIIKSVPLEKTSKDSQVVQGTSWRRKVDYPVVEDAIEHFARHLIAEWVTDLWYCKLTLDSEGPEELVRVIIDVLAEISDRARHVNLIDLLTRDAVSLFCTHLETFRFNQEKIEKPTTAQLSVELLDRELRKVLASKNKLHPALFSAEAEHKVLQHIMEGLILFTFKVKDLRCSCFRSIVRELLACAVIRPVLNLANPRFINERIECFAISRTKAKNNASAEQKASPPKNVSLKGSSDQFSDPSVTGVELVHLKANPSKNASETTADKVVAEAKFSKDPLLSMDTRSSRSWNSLPGNAVNGDQRGLQGYRSAGEWGEMLDVMSHRKAKALAPEHFDNMWTKGRNYRLKEDKNGSIEQVRPTNFGQQIIARNNLVAISNLKKGKPSNDNSSLVNTPTNIENSCTQVPQNIPRVNHLSGIIEDDETNDRPLDEADSPSSSYTSEDEHATIVTGLDSPGKKVWDGKSKRNIAIPNIHHPLESYEGGINARKTSRHLHYQRCSSNQSSRKRSRLNSKKVHVWQEVERTSFLSGDGQDILNASRNGDGDVSTDSSDDGVSGGAESGTAASSPTILESKPDNLVQNFKPLLSSLASDSFMKLKCEVVCANIVKSGSITFTVYSISVTDINNHCWSIKRRFRHFEELHRRLKEFTEYNLHLPPKHFLSTKLDVLVIQERSKLLDSYLKNVMQIPRVSGSIEVWDFLSVDSQTYYFSSSFSIIDTLSVKLDDKPSEKNQSVSGSSGSVVSSSPVQRDHALSYNKETGMLLRQDTGDSLPKTANGKSANGGVNNANEETANSLLDRGSDPSFPSEWVPPNLSIPLLDLVDAVFQVQDGGWIRRKAFWVAKQVLQLGMGDAFDEWLIDKIMLLRKGSMIASGIKHVEQILWPDGIFITKHPKRQRPPETPPSPKSVQQTAERSPPPMLTEEQHLEAERRAKFVYEMMIDRAPAAVVSLVGRKEYEQCVRDLYFFLQSTVCLKLLAFDLLELLLLSAFPELDCVFKQLHEDKYKFGDFKPVYNN